MFGLKYIAIYRKSWYFFRWYNPIRWYRVNTNTHSTHTALDGCIGGMYKAKHRIV